MYHRERFYYLFTTLTVDRPHFRDETFMRRTGAPWTQGEKRFAGTDFNHAVRQYEAILDADEDFSGEYVSEVTLVSEWSDGSGRRTIRKTVHRARRAFTFLVQQCETERESSDIRWEAREAETAGELASEVRLSVGDRCFTNAGWGTIEAIGSETVRVRLTAEGIGQPGTRGRIREAGEREVFNFPAWCFKRYAAATAAAAVAKCKSTTITAISA